MALFADRKADGRRRPRSAPETVEERLKQRIVDGDKQGLEADLDDGAEELHAARHHQRPSCSTA